MSEVEETEFHPDRTGWPPGPWDAEPDREDFVYAGFSCFIQRNRQGTWCGYVGVPNEHPAYGEHFSTVDVDVHGGLTYSDACQDHLCHVPGPGMPADVWWLGFDCLHYRDFAPAYRELDLRGAVYRDQRYARTETERLAEQLRAQAR